MNKFAKIDEVNAWQKENYLTDPLAAAFREHHRGEAPLPCPAYKSPCVSHAPAAPVPAPAPVLHFQTTISARHEQQPQNG
jgi:hypothetical protein